MKSDQSLSKVTGAFTAFIKRFHTLIFFLVVSGSLFLAIVSLLEVIELSSSTASSSDQAINSNFDEQTILKLRGGESTEINPGARKSPFTE